MKNIFLVLFVLAVISVGFATEAQAAETQIVPILEDTEIGGNNSNPASAIYTSPYVQIGNKAFYGGYTPGIYAAIKSFPENTPLKAKLVLGRATAYYGGNETYALYRITKKYDFITRSNYISLSGKIADGVLNGSTTIEFNATTLVNYIAQNPANNFGFAVKQIKGTAILVASADYPINGVTIKPYLEVKSNLPPAPVQKPEDVNKDGKINYWDQVPIIQYLYPDYNLGFPVPADYICGNTYNCDVNSDKAITDSDAIQIGEKCDKPDCSI